MAITGELPATFVPRKVRHDQSGRLGTTTSVFYLRPSQVGADLGGEWFHVQFDDGFHCACPASELTYGSPSASISVNGDWLANLGDKSVVEVMTDEWGSVLVLSFDDTGFSVGQPDGDGDIEVLLTVEWSDAGAQLAWVKPIRHVTIAEAKDRERDRAVLDMMARLFSAPEWPGGSGLEELCLLVRSTGRDCDQQGAPEWPSH